MKIDIQTGEENQILRSISTEVKKEELSEVLVTGRAMVKWLKAKNNGAWLAAPQVGLNKRMIVVNMYHEEDGEFHLVKTLLMINPVITWASETCELDEEGCFSCPGEYGKVLRSTQIRLEFRDERFLLKKLPLDGFNARIVQHEIDHLNGVLFVDKVQGELVIEHSPSQKK
jgi:peptide deformylase